MEHHSVPARGPAEQVRARARGGLAIATLALCFLAHGLGASAAAAIPTEPESLRASVTAPLAPEPDDTLAPETPTPTDSPEAPEQPGEPEPEPELTATPTPTPSVTEVPPPPTEPEQPSSPGVLTPVPPAVTTSNTSVFTWIIAGIILIGSAVVLLALRRTFPPTETAGAVVSPIPNPTDNGTDAATTFAAIEAIGEAMLDAGYSVMTVQESLGDIARVNGIPSTEIVALPTALFVSARGTHELRTGAVSSGHSRLLLHQLDALDQLVRAARSGLLSPSEGRRGIRELREAPAPYPGWLRVLAYILVCAGIAVILGASWIGVGAAAVFGGFVGTALLLSANAPRSVEPLVTVTLAFTVSTAVFLLARAGWDPGVLASLIAPLIILLPGALLTTGVIELATGEMVSGAGRLAAGFIRLVLLAVGIVAGAMLVGVPQIELSEAAQPIGPLGPWIAVAAFGVGIIVHQGGRPESIPWILLVLYVAYGAQVIGNAFFGGVLSALIGALVMTPVAILVSRNRSGPAAIVSFLPAFWLLVPGALGLVGVTSILTGDAAGGSTLVTTISTMVAIALGILAGMTLSGGGRASHRTVL